MSKLKSEEDEILEAFESSRLKRVKNADKEDRGRFETELSAADLSCANDLFALEFFECGLHGSQGFVDLGE